ncbi:Translation initiation factor 3 subunit J component [Malassezia sp. CBS 17886]|nr:Translation initiation factor 3 subunit J component [Malassezia sp. CBS 17886]
MLNVAENDDFEVEQKPVPRPLGAVQRRFEEEDVDEDEVKDDWEEEEETPQPKPVQTEPVPRKRASVKQRIAEKEEAERLRKETGIAVRCAASHRSPQDEEEEEYDPRAAALERQRQEKEAQLRSDLDNAAALVGETQIDDGNAPSALSRAKPAKKEDWEQFGTQLYNELLRPKAGLAGYDKYLFPHLLALLASQGLRDVDLRKASTKLRELAETKVKAEKDTKKTGGNKRAAAKPKQVGTSSAKNAVDMKAYGGEALDDDLDFM